MAVIKYLMVSVIVANIVLAATSRNGHAIYGWSAALVLAILFPTQRGKGGTT